MNCEGLQSEHIGMKFHMLIISLHWAMGIPQYN